MTTRTVAEVVAGAWSHDWARVGEHRRVSTFACAQCGLVLDACIPYEHLYQAATGEKLDAEPACAAPGRAPMTRAKVSVPDVPATWSAGRCSCGFAGSTL